MCLPLLFLTTCFPFMKKFILASFCAFLAFSCFAAEEVRRGVSVYPVPDSDKLNECYYVSIDGKKADCYKAAASQARGAEYYFVSYDFRRNAEIRIRHAAWKSLKDVKVFPEGTKYHFEGATLVIKAKKAPSTIIVSPDNRELPILFFGNKYEEKKPSRDDPNVIFIEKGSHNIPQVKLTSGQTLYLEEGAILKASIFASGKDITICGRGVISGELKARSSKFYFINFEDCQNLRIRDITIKDSPGWTIKLLRCNGVSIDNVKICNGRVINDDAIDICNSSNVHIKNVFARAQDDIIAVKGVTSGQPENVCENIFIKNCIFWTDRANIFRIGYDSNVKRIANLRVKDIFVPFYATDCVGLDSDVMKGIIVLQAGKKMLIENATFENIKIYSNGTDQNVFIAKALNRLYGKPCEAGFIKNCTVKNLSVAGEKGVFRGSILLDADAGGSVGDIKFEKISYFGKSLSEDFEFFNPNASTDVELNRAGEK